MCSSASASLKASGCAVCLGPFYVMPGCCAAPVSEDATLRQSDSQDRVFDRRSSSGASKDMIKCRHHTWGRFGRNMGVGATRHLAYKILHLPICEPMRCSDIHPRWLPGRSPPGASPGLCDARSHVCQYRQQGICAITAIIGIDQQICHPNGPHMRHPFDDKGGLVHAGWSQPKYA